MAMRRVICSVWQKGRYLRSPNCIRNRLNTIIHESGCVVRRNLSDFGKPLIGLPVTTKLKLSGETVVVEELKEGDFAEAFSLLERAAKRGDNVGVDEYRSVGDLLEDFCFGSVFAVRSHHRRVGSPIDALLMVGPCLASRTIRPCLASVQVVTSEGFARESFWRDFFEMAIGLAKRHSFGFSACVTQVFIHCIERVTALRKDGFVICATVPKAGKVVRRNGASPVHMHGYLMCKEFGPADNQRPTLPELVEFSKEFSKIMDKNRATTASKSTTWKPVPGLPSELLLRGSSNPLVLRQLNAQPDEIRRYYDFYRLAGEESDGFSVEEFPTQDLFWQLFQSNYNLVFEEKHSGKWMAVMHFARSLFVRSRDSTDVYDGGLIVAREFRNAGFGTQALEILMSTGRSIGCNLLFSDAPVYQIGSIAISLKQGCVISGSIPRAIYSPTHGWSDVLLFNFTDHKSSGQ